ncbi:MAG: hypothetical protein IH624_14635 [Phycisphaerae bacterium]|nr:hypothetical protein [Phycisphaerae bacterium]
MNEKRMCELLRSADAASAPPQIQDGFTDVIRRRARSVQRRRRMAAAAAATVVIAACTCMAVFMRQHRQQRYMASLEARVKSLETQVQISQRIVDAIRDHEQDQLRVRAMENELADIDDPLATLQRLEDRTAFVMVYEADRLYRQLNLTGSAVQAYKRVVELYPENRWGRIASERLRGIEENNANAENEKET